MELSATSEDADPDKHLQVPHIKQQHNWDCGLACTLMVLRSQQLAGTTLQDLYKMCGTKSVWTVDLAHLLARHGQQVTFLTVAPGAPNPAYAKESFYKTNISDDTARVLRLFANAPEAGIVLQQGSVAWQGISEKLAGGQHLAIVLVDKMKLRHSLDAKLLTSCCCGLVRLGYTGHYIVVYAYDAARCEFVVQDPASAQPCVRIAAATLDDARLCFGTDEDILFIARNRSNRSSSRGGVLGMPADTALPHAIDTGSLGSDPEFGAVPNDADTARLLPFAATWQRMEGMREAPALPTPAPMVTVKQAGAPPQPEVGNGNAGAVATSPLSCTAISAMQVASADSPLSTRLDRSATTAAAGPSTAETLPPCPHPAPQQPLLRTQLPPAALTAPPCAALRYQQCIAPSSAIRGN